MIVNNNKIKGNHGAKEKKKLDIVVIQRIGHTIILKTRHWTYKMHVFFFKEKRKKKKEKTCTCPTIANHKTIPTNIDHLYEYYLG